MPAASRTPLSTEQALDRFLLACKHVAESMAARGVDVVSAIEEAELRWQVPVVEAPEATGNN